MERAYVDHEGTIIFAGRILHARARSLAARADAHKDGGHPQDLRRLRRPDDLRRFHAAVKPTVDPGKAAERAKSINELYVEQGIELFSPFFGDRSDISFAARLMLHWSNLDKREPTVKIVCRNYSERPQPGLHDWDCPNLLWELMRTRRVKLTAQQLLSRNTRKPSSTKRTTRATRRSTCLCRIPSRR